VCMRCGCAAAAPWENASLKGGMGGMRERLLGGHSPELSDGSTPETLLLSGSGSGSSGPSTIGTMRPDSCTTGASSLRPDTDHSGTEPSPLVESPESGSQTD
jgi:hypothetical protein